MQLQGMLMPPGRGDMGDADGVDVTRRLGHDDYDDYDDYQVGLATNFAVQRRDH